MLIIGHIALSYILSQSVKLFGYNISTLEILVIIIAGCVVDLDVIVMFLRKNRISHHSYITHTPLGAILIWLLFILFFGRYFSVIIDLLVLLSLLFHFVLDDLGFWFCRLGLQNISRYPQTNWFYPIRKLKDAEIIVDGVETLKSYLRKARANVSTEMILVIVAVYIYFRI